MRENWWIHFYHHGERFITHQWITSSAMLQSYSIVLYNLICVTYSKQIDFSELWLFMLSGLSPSLGRWLTLPESPCCCKSGCPWIMDVFNHHNDGVQYVQQTTHLYIYGHFGEKRNNYTSGESAFVCFDSLSIKELTMGEECVIRVVIVSFSVHKKLSKKRRFLSKLS